MAEGGAAGRQRAATRGRAARAPPRCWRASWPVAPAQRNLPVSTKRQGVVLGRGAAGSSPEQLLLLRRQRLVPAAAHPARRSRCRSGSPACQSARPPDAERPQIGRQAASDHAADSRQTAEGEMARSAVTLTDETATPTVGQGSRPGDASPARCRRSAALRRPAAQAARALQGPPPPATASVAGGLGASAAARARSKQGSGAWERSPRARADCAGCRCSTPHSRSQGDCCEEYTHLHSIGRVKNFYERLGLQNNAA